ncbi:MAG: OmpA family protein [Myxococcota bacterium]
MRNMHKRTWVVIGTLAAFGAGCVSSGRYERLEKKYKDYKAAAEQKDAEQQAQIDEFVRTLAAERDKCAADIATLSKQIENLNAEKVGLVGDKVRLTAAAAELEAALAEVQKRKAAAEARIQEFRDLLARFKTLIDSGKLRVRIVDGKMVVELATDVLFGSGSAVLSAEGKAAVTEVAGILKTIGDRQFQIAGHTDNVPIRTAAYRSNWDLAFDRAHSVLKTMIDAGMPADHISAASYAEFKPRASNADDAGRAQNRRIEIIVVPDLSQLPGSEELQKLDSGS